MLIPKKDKEIRVCVDYRKLNAITITDTYPLPRIDDLLHAAKTTPFMSTLDLKSGYWQIKVAEDGCKQLRDRGCTTAGGERQRTSHRVRKPSPYTGRTKLLNYRT